MVRLGRKVAYRLEVFQNILERSTVPVRQRSAAGSVGLLQATERGNLPEGYIQPTEAVGYFPRC